MQHLSIVPPHKPIQTIHKQNIRLNCSNAIYRTKNSCSSTTSLVRALLTLRRVFTVCRLEFVWFGYSLSMSVYTSPLLCRARERQAHTHSYSLTGLTHTHHHQWCLCWGKPRTEWIFRRNENVKKATNDVTAQRIRRYFNIYIAYTYVYMFIVCTAEGIVWRLMMRAFALGSLLQLIEIYALCVHHFPFANRKSTQTQTMHSNISNIENSFGSQWADSVKLQHKMRYASFIARHCYLVIG